MLGKEKGHNASLQIATFPSGHGSLLQSVNRVRKKGAPRWAAFKCVHKWAVSVSHTRERRPVRGTRSRARARAGRPGGAQVPGRRIPRPRRPLPTRALSPPLPPRPPTPKSHVLYPLLPRALRDPEDGATGRGEEPLPQAWAGRLRDGGRE